MIQHICRESSNPRHKGRCACGQLLSAPHVEVVSLRARDFETEHLLMDIATRAANLSDDAGLSAFADRRAHPGGVRANLDYDREAAEELADARNYLLWGAEPLYADLNTGQFVDDYERRMRALSQTVVAFSELRRRSS